MLVLSEVLTGPVRHSTALPSDVAKRVLALRLGEIVRTFDRPIAHAFSPDVFTGIDCRLVTSSGSRPRLVGAVCGRAAITGGQILQASAMVEVTGRTPDRRPWAYYLARPGQAQTIGKGKPGPIANGFLTDVVGAGLDLGGIAERLMDEVQGSSALDRRPAFRAARTRLRWILEPSPDEDDHIAFTVHELPHRTLRISSSRLTPGRAADFAADIARHDWLVTTLTSMVEQSGLESGMDERVAMRLQPVVDHLLHLWMPAARSDSHARALWASVESASGFTRQWETQVARVRDQLTMYTIALLRTSSGRAKSA